MDNKLSTMQDEVTTELSGMGNFLGKVWNVYKQRIVTLLTIMLVSILLVVLTAAVFTALVVGTGTALPLIGIPIAVWIGIWCVTAFYMAIADQECSVKEAFHLAKPKTLAHLWVGILTSIIIFGGYLLLLIPGVIFTVLFIFTPFVLLCEDERGMNALLKSKEYVRGRWLTVGLRLFVLCIIFPALSGIVPLLGQLFILPFTFIGIYLTYEELKDTKADIAFQPSGRVKIGILATSAFGFLFIPLVIFTMMGSMFLPMLKGFMAGIQNPMRPNEEVHLSVNGVNPKQFSTGTIRAMVKPSQTRQMEENLKIFSEKNREQSKLTLRKATPVKNQEEKATVPVVKVMVYKEKSSSVDNKTTAETKTTKATSGNILMPQKVIDEKPEINLAKVVEKARQKPNFKINKVKKKPVKESATQVSALQKKKQLRKPLIEVPHGADRVKFYIDLLEDKSRPWYIRNDAARELGLAGDKRAIESLIHALQLDTHPFTRREAALALGKLDEKMALEPLTWATLDDNNEWVSQYAADAVEVLIAKKVLVDINTSK